MHETIILQGVCNRIKGAFVNLTKGDFDFDIPIAAITEIEETKRLMSKMLVIRTQDAKAITEDEYNAQKAKLLNP